MQCQEPWNKENLVNNIFYLFFILQVWEESSLAVYNVT